METEGAQRQSDVSRRVPASSGRRRRAVQWDLPRFTATEVGEGSARGLSSSRGAPVHAADVVAAGAVRELRVRGKSGGPRAWQRRRGGRSPGGTPCFVAGGVALRSGSAKAVLTLLAVVHLHFLTVGSDPVLQGQGAVLRGGMKRKLCKSLEPWLHFCIHINIDKKYLHWSI